MEKKSFKSLNIGDYVYKTADTMPGMWEILRIVNIYEEYGETHYELTWFGDDKDTSRSTEDEHIVLTVSDADIEKNKIETTEFAHYYQTWVDCGTVGVGKYIHNKTGKEYTLVQENIKEKELVYAWAGREIYEWVNGACLYKAEYENEDGPYFVRSLKNFYESFTKVG